MTINLHRNCTIIPHASSFSSAHKNASSYRRIGQNGEAGAWKASIDRSWSSGDQGTAVRPAAELAAVAAVAEAAADRNASVYEHQRMEIRSSSRGGVAMEGYDGGKDVAPGGGDSQPLAFSLPAATGSRMLTARDSPSATSGTAAAAAASTDTARNVELSSRATSSGKGEQRADGNEGVREFGSTSARSRDSEGRGGNAGAAGGAGQDRQRGKCVKEVRFCRVGDRDYSAGAGGGGRIHICCLP